MALDEWLNCYPTSDTIAIQNLVVKARREIEQQSTSKSSHALFRLIRNTITKMIKNCFLLLFLIALPSSVLAANGPTFAAPYWLSWSVLAIFVLAYILVMFEETIHLRKSKPVVLAAGIIWALVAWGAMPLGQSQLVTDAFRHGLGEYAELMLFLMVAMTYINVIEERGVFLVLRDWLLARELSSRALFWITGILSFFISAIADNLTTSLMMGAVVLAVAGRNKKFAMVACVNVVVACNAGGAFSPFGDVTTLMVWQKNIISTNGALTFFSFFNLFIHLWSIGWCQRF